MKETAINNMSIPSYLQRTYWWAYLHPLALWFWDKWLPLNAVLFGNYGRLRDMVLRNISSDSRVIMLGSCYGDLIPRLNEKCRELTVVDCVPQQLELASSKCDCKTVLSDASMTGLQSGTCDIVLIFFLLHEMPDSWRKNVLSEAYRLSGAKGRVMIVDFSPPRGWNLFGYVERCIFSLFEPFAKGFLSWSWEQGAETNYFGNLYRLVKTDKYAALNSKHPLVSAAAVDAVARMVVENPALLKYSVHKVESDIEGVENNGLPVPM